MLLNLTQLIRKYRMQITGAIHVGAHYGEEQEDYIRNGIKSVAFIEPCTKAFNQLTKKFVGHRHIKLFKLACGSRDHEAEMYVETANKGQGNSLLEPGTHLVQYPGIPFPDKERVRVVPLDSLRLFGPYNLLNMDVQGYELEVLKGATETLQYIDYIYTEVNKEDVYKGCARVEQLDEYLPQFKRVETGQWVNDAWTDALYIRK